ncbi:hypothetical protein CCL11_27650 [Pseudomonas syringae]|nr:hypothetical protein CCL11_27650 [Pseudomonas syringae]PBP64523.1 hypothetical protein CCL21_23885 [Pseudomonas syringae]
MILAEGRRSELVREDNCSNETFSENMSAFSRTSSLPRPAGRSLNAHFPGSSGLMYGNERRAPKRWLADLLFYHSAKLPSA